MKCSLCPQFLQRQIDNGANFKGNINMNGTLVRTVKHRRSERSCHVLVDGPFIDDVWGLQPWTIYEYVCAAVFFCKIWSIEIHSGLQHDSIGGCLPNKSIKEYGKTSLELSEEPFCLRWRLCFLPEKFWISGRPSGFESGSDCSSCL